MKLEEFKIGEYFYTGSGQWLCADIGTKSITAVKVVESYPVSRSEYDRETKTTTKLPDGKMYWNEIAKDPLVYGHCSVFHVYDLDGCSIEK